MNVLALRLLEQNIPRVSLECCFLNRFSSSTKQSVGEQDEDSGATNKNTELAMKLRAKTPIGKNMSIAYVNLRSGGLNFPKWHAIFCDLQGVSQNVSPNIYVLIKYHINIFILFLAFCRIR